MNTITYPTGERQGPWKLADLLDSIPANAGRLLKNIPRGAEGLDGYGNVSVFIIFETGPERAGFFDKWRLQWIETDDRCCFLNHWFTWPDTKGFGLELTTTALSL